MSVNTDRFQEVIAGALAIMLVLAVIVIAGLQAAGIARTAPPEYLLIMATGAASYYYGQRSGTTKLNGNVTRLAAAAEQIARRPAGELGGNP